MAVHEFFSPFPLAFCLILPGHHNLLSCHPRSWYKLVRQTELPQTCAINSEPSDAFVGQRSHEYLPSVGPLPQKILGPFIRRLISRKPSPWIKIAKNWRKAWRNERNIALPLTPSLLKERRGLRGTMWVGGIPWGLSLKATRFQEERGWSGLLRPK